MRPPRGSETVLVVEDEDAVRRLTTTALRRGGYHVIEAASGPAALIAHAESPDRISLLVTDVMMPKMSGLELAARLTVLQPDLKVLCVSAYSAEQVEAKGPGAWPFMGSRSSWRICWPRSARCSTHTWNSKLKTEN